MRLLFLRGQIPQDRDPAEIKYSSLKECDDLWEHLACELGDEVEILYWGGRREVEYAPGKVVRWVPDFRDYKPKKADVIFARGGFREYHSILRKSKAFKIYYGAGIRNLPTVNHKLRGYLKYGLTLQDSAGQLIKAFKEMPDTRHELWFKPAIDSFYPREVNKKYDVCYIANGGQVRIKNIKWVYKTAPKDIKILHMGFPSKHHPPPNIKTKRVLKRKMPRMISQCRVGILPYSDYDSAPRALPEMLACGLPVITLDKCNIWVKKYFGGAPAGSVTSKIEFWDMVKNYLDDIKKSDEISKGVRKYYEENLSMKKCIKHLKGLL